jgi:uncharacterized protein with NRDE domain
MCLIAFAWQVHPQFPLVLIANRDEFHARPTQALHPWPEGFLAGRDAQAGGSWLAAAPSGRWAALTNFREVPQVTGKQSRGKLVTGFMSGDFSPESYLKSLPTADFAGFNLLVSDGQSLGFLGWRQQQNRIEAGSVPPGLYGVSNGSFDEPWPKVEGLKSALGDVLANNTPDWSQLKTALLNDQTAPEHALPNTGVGKIAESLLSSVFIRGQKYGTRASQVLAFDAQGRLFFEEQGYVENGQLGQNTRFWPWV